MLGHMVGPNRLPSEHPLRVPKEPALKQVQANKKDPLIHPGDSTGEPQGFPATSIAHGFLDIHQPYSEGVLLLLLPWLVVFVLFSVCFHWFASSMIFLLVLFFSLDPHLVGLPTPKWNW